MPRGIRFVVRALRKTRRCRGTRLVDSCVAERDVTTISDESLASISSARHKRPTHIRKNPLILSILRPVPPSAAILILL